MFRFASKSTSGSIDDWEEIILGLHNNMEDEILQTIHTTNQNTLVYFFENLKEWLLDRRISNVNKEIIINTINQYNDKTYEEFSIRIEKKVEEYQKDPNFIREHLEEYEVEFKGSPGLFGGHILPKPTYKKVNYKYYCILESPELIDTAYLNEYLQLVNRLIHNFKRIVNKYVSQYDTGKIVPNSSIILEKTRLRNSPEPKALPEPFKDTSSKLKVNLSVKQVAYLFKLLLELKPDIFDIQSKAELYRFISANFITKGTEEKSISTNSLNNLFSNPEKDTAKFWVALLRKMLERARNE